MDHTRFEAGTGVYPLYDFGSELELSTSKSETQYDLSLVEATTTSRRQSVVGEA